MSTIFGVNCLRSGRSLQGTLRTKLRTACSQSTTVAALLEPSTRSTRCISSISNTSNSHGNNSNGSYSPRERGTILQRKRHSPLHCTEQQRRTFFGSRGPVVDYVDLPPNYQDEEGLPFRKDGDVDLATTAVIFQGFADMTPWRANKLLKILHGRRVAGTLEDPELQENTASFSRREIERALEYLRKTTPVDEITNAGLRAEDELRALEAQTSEEIEAQEAQKEKEGGGRKAGSWLYKDGGVQDVYGESQNWGGLATYQPGGARPLEVMSAKELEYRAAATSGLEAPPDIPTWRLLLPSTLFVAALVPLLWWAAEHWYAPASEETRLMPWASKENATIYGLLLLNLAVFVAWKRMPFWKFMNKWFVMDMAMPRAVQTVTAVFSHQTPTHLAENMFFLWLLGGLLQGEVSRAEYLAIFLSCGAAGFLASLYRCVLRGHLTYGLGASSATFGVICAYFWLYRFDGFKILGLPPDPYNGVQGLGVIGLIVGLNLIPAFRHLPGQKDWVSHLAGIATGIGFAELIERRRKEKEGEGNKLLVEGKQGN
ncbi:hypothetical protein VPNG_09207 [Cytospora leucostoma]|uniref:Peptidase S54 rhomboid domain-containing protein n=1 Tax=Cytospora leucostoma TaxID=1230097 RepID=A0A423VUG2_9PEZI|nr:hypothetical protein VPNG_09207 [Cytospora leucostoma]